MEIIPSSNYRVRYVTGLLSICLVDFILDGNGIILPQKVSVGSYLSPGGPNTLILPPPGRYIKTRTGLGAEL